jgi:hypothetical protein
MSVNRKVTDPTGFGRVSVAEPSSVMLLLRHRPDAGRQSPQDRQGEGRAVEECLLEVPRRKREAARRLDRHDLGDSRQSIQDGQLAEELAGPENRNLLTVTDDADGALDHQEEARPDLALPGDDPVGRELDLDRSTRHGGQVVRPDPGEQPTGTEQLGSPNRAERRRFLLRHLLMLPLPMAVVNRSPPPSVRMREGPMSALREVSKPMANGEEIVDQIAGFALFADLATPQLERVAHTFEEQWYAADERVLRQGLTGSAFHIILDGDAAVLIDGQQRATLSRGDFFGEVSILLGEPPVADVVALRPLRCLVLAGGQVRTFLLDNPSVMYRMLQAQARRLRNANRWRS